jgi:hypothetical protein
MPFAVIGPRFVHSQPQLRPVCLGMPCPDPDVTAGTDGGLVADPDDPRLTALAPDRDLPPPQVDITALSILGVVHDPGQFRKPDPRRPEHRDDREVAALGNDRPAQAFSSLDSSPLVKTGMSFSVTLGGRSLAIGSGRSSSPAHHLKNCCRARYWLLA